MITVKFSREQTKTRAVGLNHFIKDIMIKAELVEYNPSNTDS